MKIRNASMFILFVLLCVTLGSWASETASPNRSIQIKRTPPMRSSPDSKKIGGANEKQEKEIKALIEQLVYKKGEATNRPVRNPLMKIYNAEGKVVKPSGDSKKIEQNRKKFESCQMAFQKLYEMKGPAFPILLEHLDDKRQSINFRNHYTGNSVGNACYWNIYYQLMDQPRDYSEYGHSREGRDGKLHPKPYWEGTPFDDAGGLKKWFAKNKNLNYIEMQIKCLGWLLEKEKLIGASDADSYFLNIVPLEIRILERRYNNGDDVKSELNRLIKIKDEKLTDQIPKELLPD